MNKNSGFTLIELLIIIAIFAIITTLALPRFESTLENFKLNLAGQQVARHIALAREKALSEGVTVRLIFDLHSKDNYQILVSIQGSKFVLPPGVKFSYTNFPGNTLEFYPSGVPSQGGTVAISGKYKTYYVIVTPVTARVRIGDSPPVY
ncbi:GspH/FimT family protein [Thermovenabulum gondwanense]|uniref:General secretion pathway GspH domain-containing protein n=1 Tax=Thermovenabulum gondwanense TaxID=520767 RepID=A0A162MH34_9FIRM|nr:GspH/FimT family protein [Thermovenabulum gondwanense]KYO65837.1 hypothetical protein ATZ99_14750 [Thermovenabulum gondwanense]